MEGKIKMEGIIFKKKDNRKFVQNKDTSNEFIKCFLKKKANLQNC